MTMKFKFALMSAALIAGASLTSCSNEGPVETGKPTAEGNLLVKSPEMLAYSSNHILSTYGTKGDDVEGEEVVAEYVSHNDIEINLSINDKIEGEQTTNEGETFDKEDFISSHFSLHIRTPRDVKVTVPVASEYYCEADDMMIVKKHLEDNLIYGDQNHELSMNINGNIVKVTVDYTAEGFTITTDGVNEAVINYLAEEYKDGLTFEIWNYYNETVTREGLKVMLDQSTVEFIGGADNVDYYVNAINELKDYDEETEEEVSRTVNPLDCTVSIVADQEGDFEAVTPGSEAYFKDFYGYNGSFSNRVYKHKKEADEDEDEDETPEGE